MEVRNLADCWKLSDKIGVPEDQIIHAFGISVDIERLQGLDDLSVEDLWDEYHKSTDNYRKNSLLVHIVLHSDADLDTQFKAWAQAKQGSTVEYAISQIIIQEVVDTKDLVVVYLKFPAGSLGKYMVLSKILESAENIDKVKWVVQDAPSMSELKFKAIRKLASML
ncbi:MAG: hypothetical protein MRY49_00935 [Candidatus Pacebacteria bacterium]|nr:hypothetical protein [Candidatus Paceibacterota bacterium]